MKAMFDLNIILDVLQLRQPWAYASGEMCARAVRGEIDAFVAPHVATTLFYVLRKHADYAAAERGIDWLLATSSFAPCDKDIFLRARALSMRDFEDSVIAASAEASHCDIIMTRNIGDFTGSPIPALSPEDFLG